MKNQRLSERLHGIWPVMVTPYNEELEIDLPAYRAMIEWYIEKGCHGLYALCLSSEMYNLTRTEQMLLVKEALKINAGRVPIAVTGNLGASLQEELSFASSMHELGADVVMLTVPPQLSSNVELRNYFMEFVNKTDCNLGLYECPYPRQFHLSLELITQLVETGRFYAFKETSCNIDKINAIIQILKDSPLSLMQANIPFFLDAQIAGADGSMNVVANWLPDLVIDIYEKIKTGNIEEASLLHLQLCAMEMAQRSVHPTGVKYLMSKRGLPIKPHTRLPQKLSSEERKALDLATKLWFNPDGTFRTLVTESTILAS
ncbi:MAG: dihydrodipicolinate synthase family protein [Saprospiraceae bacterium]|nr:dihydrodipicolinate synthase family protein [Saprospiraceae bacterium]